eukprot:Sro440_g143410.2  (534) ;mRNA; r:20650-22251
MTGKGESPTRVLVTEGPSTALKESSLGFTSQDTTEASITSLWEESLLEPAEEDRSPFDDNDSCQDDFIDPYLRKQTRRRVKVQKNEYCSSKRPMRSSNRENNFDPTCIDVDVDSDTETEYSFTNQVISFVAGSEYSQEQYNDEDDDLQSSLPSESTSPFDEPCRRPIEPEAPKKTTSTTNKTTTFKSLGTFDFPITETTTSTAEPTTGTKTVNGISKSLGSGCFEIPPKPEESASPSSTAKAEGFSFTTPLSAIGKSILAIGSLAILPKALQFDLITQQPPTPLSQTEPSNQETPQMTQRQAKAERECARWKDICQTAVQVHGKHSVKTAEALLQLGHAYMHAGEYAQAVVTFQSACRIWNRRMEYREDRLAFARVVDSIGMAWTRVTQDEDVDHCHKAMAALEEAFQIRYELLGPWHPDCVETLNKIASVHLHLREYSEACNAYFEVFHVRKAIFGANHPSVAIAAHALGNVLVKLASTEEASRFFDIAVDIYDRMNLPIKHPAVTRLMRDQKRLDRLSLTRLPMQPLSTHR